MKKALLLIITLSSSFLFGQTRKNQFALDPTSNSHSVYIRFKTDQLVNSSLQFKTQNPIATFFEENAISIVEGLDIDEQRFNELEKISLSLGNGDQSVKNLKNIYLLQISNQNPNHLEKLAQKLESFNEVEYVSFISNSPIQPPFIQNLVTTPDLEPNQGYLDASLGINARYAWSLGITGQNIDVTNIEYGFKKNHEMLVNLNHVQLESNATINPTLLDPTSTYHSYLDHGTAVASILASAQDGIGLTGTSFGLNRFVNYLEWTTNGYNRNAAVTRALNNASPGSIVMYEMQTGGYNNEYVPAEYNNVVWDLTKAATDAGIIVIAAAGNGNQNLDSEFYQPYMNRGNSGAIIVGAGSSNATHSRLSFSTYGSRLDLQGWGQNVLAAGYGSYATYDGDGNRTYTQFNGTSSATPVVASAAVLVQSYYHQQTGNYMTPAQIKELLISTATPQGGNTTQKIGPLPNVKTAIEKINQTLKITDVVRPLELKIYPNPANQILHIASTENNTFSYEIYNLIGQRILTGTTKDEIRVSDLSKGNYFIKITDGKRIVVEKFIKN